MIRLATIPMIGAAVGVVWKYCIGIRFWIWGVPGIAVMVKVKAPRATVPGINRRGRLASRKRLMARG